jgi:hypothetical protein
MRARLGRGGGHPQLGVGECLPAIFFILTLQYHPGILAAGAAAFPLVVVHDGGVSGGDATVEESDCQRVRSYG